MVSVFKFHSGTNGADLFVADRQRGSLTAYPQYFTLTRTQIIRTCAHSKKVRGKSPRRYNSRVPVSGLGEVLDGRQNVLGHKMQALWRNDCVSRGQIQTRRTWSGS